ncbi:prolyl 4-hydroxylase subunit alpha-3 [Plakobranchus ocellatus]|uniref:procollagen-proline 4-dioxygenase n=1 Tax=Plakobranchus ocellatus TaxID=259542 RepID=A0AAV4A3G1_9GAST|nr:prolyl 4-hydroxylase subunit alpha-3 [Plakobranchus ocellatus]
MGKAKISVSGQIKTRLNICAGTVAMVTLVSVVSGDIFTSSLKVKRLVQEEAKVLDELKRYIDLQYDRLKTFSNFYTDRVRDINLNGQSKLLEDLHHPNAVYRAIKRFSSDYAQVLGENLESFRRSMATSRVPFEAGVGDIRGASLSLLRLQSVYHLKAMDMAEGDYLGYYGPPLTVQDTFEVGQLAFSESMLNASVEWLNVTLDLLAHPDPDSAIVYTLSPAHVKALMGRVHLYAGNVQMARSYYDEVRFSEPLSGDAQELGVELHSRPRAKPREEMGYFQNFSRLCSLDNRLHVPKPLHPSMICRYREALLPYYRFKEEILSVRPFASVVYNVTSDTESEILKDRVKHQLVRGQIGGSHEGHVSDLRTSDLGWVWDNESPVAAEISLRIKHLTGLEVAQKFPEGPTSAEPFQVVNYGLGGHYEVHLDPFEDGTSPLPALKHSGNRIATFLMYLSDVTRGGSTVFTKADIAVPPIKAFFRLVYGFCDLPLSSSFQGWLDSFDHGIIRFLQHGE